MKKWLTVLLLAISLMGLSACAGVVDERAEEICNQVYTVYTTTDVLAASDLDDDDMEIYLQSLEDTYGVSMDAMAYEKSLSSWESETEILGELSGIKSITMTNDTGKLVAQVEISGSNYNGTMEIVFSEDYEVTSVTTNVIYPLGYLMEYAALNTLLGMGTVFAVLILISMIISLFAYIPKWQKKKAQQGKETLKTQAFDNAIAQIAEREEEELSDNQELVAVIAAAIAAYEGTSVSGLVVRSIKKSNSNRWQKA